MRRKLKKIVVAIALATSLLVPVSASAAETKFTGGPLTNLDSTSATIHIALSNFPTKGGLYIQECVAAPVGTRPAICNNAVQLWVSTAGGASFVPTADIIFKPTGTFMSGTTAVDCTVSKCGIFMRYDHTVPGDLSEDQFIPLTFKAAVGTATTLAPDEVSATLNGVVMSTKAPIKLAYRAPAILAATSKAGATLTYTSFAPACTLVGMTVTGLKGSGYCDIAVTSPGNASASSVTAHFPIELIPGVQTLGVFALPESAKAFSKITLPSTTNFGETIKYKAIGACSVVRSTLTLRRGNCEINTSAIGRPTLYAGLNAKLTIVAR